ncbi:MAG: AmmeMemoRadiSam system protein B [FCB group bacterium]|nr:AmmeMemoRadiSam system protein B [FCB group bacterium]MBL7028601.1 AmmeMemoRadiSam system protein B [Candidatus Neomarinimicrobiota bacterium]MBL7120820.1 AmmeMemoRadiSam system protein B [Candidatus Neomarinimicrobiota bacterium]
MKQIRPPAVSGMFYPGDPHTLEDQIANFIQEKPNETTVVPKVIIVPHAGTVYSGSIAAAAYRTLLQYRHVIRKVILLGPAHRVFLHGLALPTVDQFQTPLGEINLDTQTIQNLVDEYPQISISDQAHAEEHSLEVQLPFLQKVLASFRLIPFVVGEATQKEVADVIETLWGGDECLIVISTDLSHFHSYDEAIKLDTITARRIESFQGELLGDHSACGRIPLRGLLQVAKHKGMSIKRLDLRNSGDTSGRNDQVVGYGAWGLFEV